MKISTFRTIFFSLFIALNCFILERTALSIGLSDASPPSLSHGCSAQVFNTHISIIIILFSEKLLKFGINALLGSLRRTWPEVSLFFGSRANIFLTRSLALSEIDGQG